MTRLSDDQAAGVRRIENGLGSLQKVTAGSITIEMIRVFLTVATNPGISVIEVAERSGQSRGTASRQLLDLGIKRRSTKSESGKVEGFGLVEPFIDPDDLRLKRYRCTPKGYTEVRKMAKLMGVLA